MPHTVKLVRELFSQQLSAPASLDDDGDQFFISPLLK
jgi:hypothetical protein